MEGKARSEGLSVLIVDDSWTMVLTLSNVVASTTDMVVAGRASSGSQGMRLALDLQPEIVLMDVSLPDADAFHLVSALTVKLPRSTIVLLSDNVPTATLQHAMASGAHAYLPKTVSPETLLQTIRSARSKHMERLSRIAGLKMTSREYGEVEGLARRRGRFIAVAGAKGGVGKTTLAANLAVALRTRTGQQVAAIDADFAFGDLALHLNVASDLTILDLLSRAGELDGTMVDKVLSLHPSGLRVLLGPNLPEHADLIGAKQLSPLFEGLSKFFDYIVIDCQQSYDDRLLSTLDRADLVLLVLTPEVGPVRNTTHFLRLSQLLNYQAGKIQLVVNRADSNVGISPLQIQRMLGLKEVLTLPSGGRIVVQSVNKGSPLVLDDPESNWAKSIHTMAQFVEGKLADAPH
jgi:pilus assembly protein CpaE